MPRLTTIALLATLTACGNGRKGSAIKDGEVAFEDAGSMPLAYPEVTEITASPSGEFVAAWMGQQVYVSDGQGWHTATSGSYIAVANSGSVFALNDDGLVRTNADGTSELLDLGLFFRLGQRTDTIRTGADGSVWVSGSEVLNGTPTVWRSIDDGETWTATEVQRGDFSGGGQITTAFYVNADGVLYSMRGSRLVRRSSDNGATWTDIPTGLPATPIDSTTIPVVSNAGDFCRAGHDVIEGFDAATETYVRMPRADSPIAPTHGALSVACVIDDDGAVTRMARILSGSPDGGVPGGAVFRYDGTWTQIATVPSHAVYTGTSIHTDGDSLIVGSGLAGVAHIDSSGAVSTSVPPQSSTGPIGARRIVAAGDGVVLIVSSGASTAGAVNATTPALIQLQDGVATTLDVVASDALRTSHGDIFAYAAGQLRISTDGGLTFGSVIDAHTPDPQQLNNLIRTDARLMVQQGDQVHIRVNSLKGGVSGLYTDPYRIVTDLQGQVLETREHDLPLAASTDPLITGAKGEVGYWLHPGYYLDFMGQQPEQYFVSENAYTVGGNYDGPMPSAGSDNGYFVAFVDDGSLAVSSPGDEQLFEPVVATFEGTPADLMPTLHFTEASDIQHAPPQGVAFPLVSFDPDGHLYFVDPGSGRIYRSIGAF